MEQYREETKWVKGKIYWFIGLMIVLSISTWLCNRTIKTVDNGIIHYEEFQDINNTCIKLNTDLCNMKDLSETDKMFEQFSKAQRINTIKTNLNRWVQEYNAKSKMFNRNIWKSSALPYELQINQFTCY